MTTPAKPTLSDRLRAAAAALESDTPPPATEIAALTRALVETLPEPTPENDVPLVIHTGVPAIRVNAYGQSVDAREVVMRAFAAMYGYQAEVEGSDGTRGPNPMSRAKFVTHQLNRFIWREAKERLKNDLTESDKEQIAQKEQAAEQIAAGVAAEIGLDLQDV